MKLAPHPGVGSRDGCFNFRSARYVAGVWWYGGCLAPLHTPAWREDEVIAAGLLAPGFQLSARAGTAAVAEALARDQPYTLQPFLACWSYTQGLWQLG